MHGLRFATGLAMAALCSGPLPAAQVMVDANPGTLAIDSLHQVGPTAGFRVAVRVSGARYLDSYSFELSFDPALLTFVRADAEDIFESNILKTRGGVPVSFIGRLSQNDPAKVLVVHTLARQDSTRSPSGDGLLAFIQFQGKAPGKSPLGLGDVQLLDWQRETDSAVATLDAAIILDNTVSLRRAGTLPVLLAVGPAAGAVDIRGRRLYALRRPSLPYHP